MVSTPSAPDPYATAAAQTASNKDTAAYQSRINMVNQTTPYGSVNYANDGTDPVTGAPIYSATTSLSQPVQNLVNSNISNAQGNSDLEGQLQKNAAASIQQPVDLSWNATEENLDKLGKNTLDPQFQQGQNQLDQSLAQRGITPGSEQYNFAQTQFGNQKNNAYNNLYLTGQQQAANEILQQHNSPLNDLASLQSGSQIAQPGVGQTASTTPTSVAGTNVAGLVEQNYQSQLAQSNAAMGGLFGLGGALGSAFLMSDKRLKEDVEKVGKLDNGLPVYSYKYKAGGPKQIGLMAQDVEKVKPDAIGSLFGYKAVNYDRATA